MSDYNIQMHEYNGSGYDNLYPKTKSNMVLDGDTNLETKLKYYSNENLLDNWCFVGGGSQQGGEQFPINQRSGYVVPVGTPLYTDSELTNFIANSNSVCAVISFTNEYCYVQDPVYSTSQYYTPASAKLPGYVTGYGIDRWRTNGGTLNISANGVYLSTNYTMYQLCKGFDVRDGRKIFSLLDTEGNFGSVIIGGGYVEVTPHFAVTHAGDNIIYILSKNSSVGIVAVKLETGDTQTLAHQDANGNWVLNEIPNYQEQLFRCKTSTADVNDVCANMANTVGPKFVCNPNLLDNWYFNGGGSQQGGGQLPINQRNGYVVPPNSSQSACYTDSDLTNPVGPITGYRIVTISGTNSSGVAYVGWVYEGVTYYTHATNSAPGYLGYVYGIDRWAGASNTEVVTISNSYVRLDTSGAGGYLIQQLENPQEYEGRILTASILLNNGSLYSCTGKVQFGSPLNIAATAFASSASDGLYIYTGGTNLQVHVQKYGNEPIDIIAIKLELGDKQTLAHQENGVWVLNEVPNYKEQLSRCQRYYQRYTIYNQGEGDLAYFGTGMIKSTNEVTIIIPTSKMRIKPTGNLYGKAYIYDSDFSNTKSVESIASGLSAMRGDGPVKITFIASEGVSFVLGSSALALFRTEEGSSYLELSADL